MRCDRRIFGRAPVPVQILPPCDFDIEAKNACGKRPSKAGVGRIAGDMPVRTSNLMWTSLLGVVLVSASFGAGYWLFKVAPVPKGSDVTIAATAPSPTQTSASTNTTSTAPASHTLVINKATYGYGKEPETDTIDVTQKVAAASAAKAGQKHVQRDEIFLTARVIRSVSGTEVRAAAAFGCNLQ